MKKKSKKKVLDIFLFYTIVSFAGIFVLPILGIIAPVFIICGILTPILGFVKLIGYIFNINIPFIIMQLGTFTLNPILGFILTIFVGILLYLVGVYAWKLLFKYVHIISSKKRH